MSASATSPSADSASPVSFTFEGRTLQAKHGQSIGAALYAAGVRIFSRSFKYHRPRGLFCVSGDCPNCLMNVNGRPNVRTCIEPAEQGQVVRSQNNWPSLEHDCLRIFDRMSYFLPVGFYYKRFHKPAWLWPIFERLVRNIAGLGRIDVKSTPIVDAEVEYLHTDVCVIGAGPAGMAAASAAANAGAEVLLLERDAQVGGHLVDESDRQSLVESLVRDCAKVRMLLGTTVFGLYEGNLLAAFRGQRLLKVRAKQIIVCTGGRQRPFLFANNDLPGIFLAGGVLRLARRYGVRAGQRAVILTDNDSGQRVAEELNRLGIKVAAVIDTRSNPTASSPATNWPVLSGHTVVQARGNASLKAVRVAPVGSSHQAVQEIACDVLCLASQLVPANELLRQGGVRFSHEGGRWRPNQAESGLLAAGAAAGTFAVDAAILEGRLRGVEAAAALGRPCAIDEEQRSKLEQLRERERTEQDRSPAYPNSEGGKRFVCLCEDVTEKDMQQAIAEGFDEIEPLKRYSTVSMGPCQGKMCGQKATELCAHFTQREVGTVGTTTSRPPLVPVELAVLAAERRHHPIRRTPLHHWHQAHGARWLDAGQWKRTESYGDPLAEVRAVRDNVGLIDVSTLGKIEVVGPDAAELLERVCLPKWADMKVGRVRYSVLCTEDGILFDDGVGARLGPDRFYLTASTGNAEAVFQWLELWRTTWRLDALVLNRTSALAAMNLAGPRSRDVLQKLTDLDLSSTAFPYLALREGEVANVPCRLLRLGFVGELGYEIHCPSAYAWHLWTAVIAAGESFGLKPFGVEAQRILRLEKGHLIVGQDTDALSNPLDAGLGGLVRFDKPEFHGRAPLLRYQEMKTPSRLVGFELPTSPAVQSMEGCQIIEDNQSAGRVTSVRFSPTLNKTIGLAWVPAAKTTPGERFFIRCNGDDVPAVVAALPFYDPRGERLKA